MTIGRLAVAAAGAALFATQPAIAQMAPAPSQREPDYLTSAVLPEAGLSPAPPAPGSSAEARDAEAEKAALALRGSARWTLAISDADLSGGTAANAFSCAAGIALGPQTTPRTNALLRKSAADLGLSTSAIKRRYQRPRPFMVNGLPSCTPDWEPVLRKDGSYPSGHSAIGFGWGLILAELLPDRAALLVARGRAFGDSRRICNVHWLSDVEEGRIAGATTVAPLNGDRKFQKDLAAARKELRRAKTPPAGCDAEAAALALVP